MSSIGWEIVHAIDERYEAGQRRGQPQPWERSRILAGDYSAIVREFEPAAVIELDELDEDRRPKTRPGLVKGATHVLSWSRPTGSLDQVGRALPKPPPEPLLWIMVTKVVRHRDGGWRVRFDVFDRRVDRRLIRRKPPARPLVENEQVTDDMARIQSAYTTNPKEAIDGLDAVDDGSLERYGEEAEQTQALRQHHNVGARLQAIEGLPARERVTELHKLASEQGIDCRDDLKAFERRLKRRLGLAA